MKLITVHKTQFLNQILKMNQILTFTIHPKYQGEDELISSDFKSHILLESDVFDIFEIVKVSKILHSQVMTN